MCTAVCGDRAVCLTDWLPPPHGLPPVQRLLPHQGPEGCHRGVSVGCLWVRVELKWRVLMKISSDNPSVWIIVKTMWCQMGELTLNSSYPVWKSLKFLNSNILSLAFWTVFCRHQYPTASVLHSSLFMCLSLMHFCSAGCALCCVSVFGYIFLLFLLQVRLSFCSLFILIKSHSFCSLCFYTAYPPVLILCQCK